MLTLSSQVLLEIGATIARPLWLVQLGSGIDILRLCSWDVNFSWNSFTWVATGFQIPQLDNDYKNNEVGSLIFADGDQAWWALALQNKLTNIPASAWMAYAGAPNNAVPKYAGRTGAPRYDEKSLSTVVALLNEASAFLKSPREPWVQLIGPENMTPPGSVLQLGGQIITLERDRS